MIALTAPVASPWTATLVNLAAGSIAIGVLTGLGLGLLRARSAALRHALLVCALAMLLALPLLARVSAALPGGEASASPSPALEVGVLGPVPSGQPQPRLDGQHGRHPQAVQAPDRLGPARQRVGPKSPDREAPWMLLAGALWLCGTLLSLAAVARGWARLGRMLAGSRPGGDPRWGAELAAARVALGLRRPVELLFSPRVAAPLSLGWKRARIAIPADLERELRRGEIRAVLLHELAHIQRCDHIVGFAQRIASALYWWNPLVHRIGRALAAAREEICDNHVLRHRGGARAFARCLLALAGRVADRRSCHLSMGLFRAHHTLERRVRNLLQKENDLVIRTTRNSKCALALLSTVLAATLALCGVRAQEHEKAKGADGMARFLPLAEGALWEYDFHGDAGTAIYSYLVRGTAKVKNGSARELRCRYGQRAGYEYWAARPEGIYRYHNRYLGGLRGVNPRREPSPLLIAPVERGHTWRWTEQGSVQVMGDTPFPPRDELRIHHEATIAAVSEEVAVPAGRFRAVRVEIHSRSKFFGNSRQTWWFAPGVGCVKRVEAGHNREVRYELRRHRAGRDPSGPEPDEALREHLATAAPWSSRGAPRSLTWFDRPCLTEWFRSRFARVHWERSGASIFRVHRGRVTLFDPRSRDAWRALMADEGLRVEGDLMGDADQVAGNLARACAYLVATSADFDARAEIRFEERSTSHAFRSGEWEARCTSYLPGSRRSSAVYMRFAKGLLVELGLRIAER